MLTVFHKVIRHLFALNCSITVVIRKFINVLFHRYLFCPAITSHHSPFPHFQRFYFSAYLPLIATVFSVHRVFTRFAHEFLRPMLLAFFYLDFFYVPSFSISIFPVLLLLRISSSRSYRFCGSPRIYDSRTNFLVRCY